jgi:hypothetical protein
MSPLVFRLQGIKFHFFANEGTPREPVHIHASRGRDEAKIWLHPTVSIAKSRGYDRRELAMLVSIVRERSSEIERAWYEFFSQNP